MFVYCPLCGKRAPASHVSCYVCLACEPYQRAVNDLAGAYQGMIPEAALKALTASLHQYDPRTGELVSDAKSASVRTAIASSLRTGFGGAFRLPSLIAVDVSSLYRFLLMTLLNSDLLPARLTDEVRAYLDQLEQRKQRLEQVVTYQCGSHWYAYLMGSDPAQEPALSGENEVEALQKLYARHPELGSLTA
ncbi:MAG TPA: hypothetical protein VFV38_13370 [Ktedonobacteraceae bacterium]|nr:hypothetical protein [Ktedonobacteraceae bacterium]